MTLEELKTKVEALLVESKKSTSGFWTEEELGHVNGYEAALEEVLELIEEGE